ncbi:MAG TPA: hypothetical protein VNJ04_12635, partial [Gemmatimonadaceae bacterium]|nr:hypothetical protein [Gemmatimonadaceae bacterium]
MGLSAALFALAVGVAPVDSARVHVLTDTTSVTVRIAVPAGRDAGALVDATITSAADESTLWKGQLGRLAADGSGGAALTRKVSGLDARRWSPDSPSLYHLTVRYARGDTSISERVRFGFRSVSADSGRILLNGKPIFLRGNAINPPDRNIPD